MTDGSGRAGDKAAEDAYDGTDCGVNRDDDGRVEEGTGAGAAASVEVAAAGGNAADAANAEGAAARCVLATPPLADGMTGAEETGAVAAALTPTGRDHVGVLDCGTRAAVELTALGADVAAVPAVWPTTDALIGAVNAAVEAGAGAAAGEKLDCGSWVEAADPDRGAATAPAAGLAGETAGFHAELVCADRTLLDGATGTELVVAAADDDAGAGDARDSAAGVYCEGVQVDRAVEVGAVVAVEVRVDGTAVCATPMAGPAVIPPAGAAARLVCSAACLSATASLAAMAAICSSLACSASFISLLAACSAASRLPPSATFCFHSNRSLSRSFISLAREATSPSSVRACASRSAMMLRYSRVTCADRASSCCNA